ncbi:MAG: tyrosine-type recombinase/integrase [Streptococcaceae bacterium]|nr:tyrosine-type recombinase/integrase [Streptococcaceae bacterium]MCL2681288.1 tyrosine-type recombinase/integrase [Streptococcaceae bacterium]
MATKNGLRIYPEKSTGKSKYRAVMDYYHPQEERWKQVTCRTDSTTKKSLEGIKNKLSLKVEKILGEGGKSKAGLTVAEAMAEWLTTRKGAVADGTHVEDLNVVRPFVAQFGRWKVSKVEKDHVKDYLLALPIAPASMKNYRSRLNLFFEFCEDEGYIRESPMYRLRMPKHKETLEEKQKREDKNFTVDEMRKLLKAMENRADLARTEETRRNNWRKRYFVEFQFLMGDRISESVGLRVQDVDFENGVLHLLTQLDVVNSRSNSPKLKTLKTKHSEQDILLKRRELEIIHWFIERNDEEAEFIFLSEQGALMKGTVINSYLQRFCDVLPYKLKSSFVSHALRHGNVMLQKELGIDEQVIVQRGGWSDTQMISRVYGRHVTPVLLERADLALKDFSLQNSRNIHEKTDEIWDLRRSKRTG